MLIEGYIINISFLDDLTHVWIKTRAGDVQHLTVQYHPVIYATPPTPHIISTHPSVFSVSVTKALPNAESFTPCDVLKIEILSPKHLSQIKKYLKKHNFQVFNADLPPREKFFYDTRCFPFGLCRFSIHGGSFQVQMMDSIRSSIYRMPSLSIFKLEITLDTSHFPNWDDSLTGFRVLYSPVHIIFLEPKYRKLTLSEINPFVAFEYSFSSKDEREILETIMAVLHKVDPDFILIEDGDRFTVNYLAHCARRCGMQSNFYLGRLKRRMNPRKNGSGQSYVSYGTIVYKDTPVYIHGRIHIDPSNSFFFRDSGVLGVIELSRLAAMPPDRCSRSSIGTVLTSIELQLVSQLTPPVLIPPTKAKGETFKSSEDLLFADSGGILYPATPGIYEDVWGIDFTSLYPAIMLKHNISSETVLCKCCSKTPAKKVPGLPYHVCGRKQGIVARTMQLVMSRRLFYKYIKPTCESKAQYMTFDQADSALKWILVACLDGSSLIYRRRGDMCIPERLDHFVDHFSPLEHYEVLGIDDMGKPEYKLVKGVVKISPQGIVYRIKFEDGTKITATDDHLWPVPAKTGWEVIRTDQLSVNTSVIKLVHSNFLSASPVQTPLSLHSKTTTVVSIQRLPTTPKSVYCIQLDSSTPWFVTDGGIVTHNCFGYLGFKNARWGSIESHQCVTAYARYYLNMAEQIAYEHGYVTIAGITDSLFVKAKEDIDDTPEKMNALINEISKRLGIPMDVDGKFNWIVFTNLRERSDVSALNRYYGSYLDGSLKIRGIEARKRSTCKFIRDFQLEILSFLSLQRGKDGFLSSLPVTQRILDMWMERIQKGVVNPLHLVLTTRSTKGVGGYSLDVIQASVTQRYLLIGRNVKPGQSVRYVVTNFSASGIERIITEPELTETTSYDKEWYSELLVDAYMDLLGAVISHPITTSQDRITTFFSLQ